MIIIVKTIPHSEQRYPTVGDWWFEIDGSLHVRVSEMGNPKYEFLIAYHEIAEAMLCHEKGIKVEDIDAFDTKFEEEREQGLHSPTEEPGDSKDAPYKEEHFFATSIERLMAQKLGVDWREYDDTVTNL